MNKMRVLIAEDEIAIANLIKGLIDFDRLNLELIGHALNGQIAYEMIKQHQPDIVITDISMPLMNGLEMITKTRKDGLSSHFIIISGLTHFQYALSAIKMGVDDYLLKPINRDELNDVLEKTIVKIATLRKIDYQIQKLNIDANLQSQKLRRSFIMDILYHKQHIENITIDTLNDEYEYHVLPNSSFVLGIAQVDGITQLNLPTQNTIIEQMMRSFQTGIKERCIDSEVYNKNNQFIFLINYHTEHAAKVFGSISAIHEDLQNYLDSYEKISIVVSCGNPINDIRMISYSLTTAYEALKARIILGSSQVLFAQQLIKSEKLNIFNISDSDASFLRSNIDIQDQQKIQSTLVDFFKKAAASVQTCPQRLPEVYRNTLSDILSDLHQHKLLNSNPADTYMQYCDAMEQYYTLKDLVKYTVSFIMDLLPLRNEEENQENRIIQTAKQYIQEHFHENIKLEDVAEQVYLAPTYFGVLFKKEAGDSFSSYLTMVRMEKAKEFLKDSRYNIAEVANATGYQDKRYFSKLFKEQVGVTPKEYRKIYL